VTWGINPGQGISINETIPDPAKTSAVDEKASIEEALAYMKLRPGAPIKGTKIDVAFLGSCTNGRLSDFQEVAKFVKGKKVAAGVKAIAVPGSQIVAIQCEKLGLDKILAEAGFEWRAAGCSMCLAMNPDKLIGDQLCASSSNRNFKGRQGSPTGPYHPHEPAHGRGSGGHRKRGGRARSLRGESETESLILTNFTTKPDHQCTISASVVSLKSWLSKKSPRSAVAACTSPAMTSTPIASSRRAS
jgi:hypothetical protein